MKTKKNNNSGRLHRDKFLDDDEFESLMRVVSRGPATRDKVLIELAAKIVQESLRILFCSAPPRFERIFGKELGPHLWYKLSVVYNFDNARFIVELDDESMAALVNFTLSQLNRSESGNGE